MTIKRLIQTRQISLMSHRRFWVGEASWIRANNLQLLGVARHHDCVVHWDIQWCSPWPVYFWHYTYSSVDLCQMYLCYCQKYYFSDLPLDVQLRWVQVHLRLQDVHQGPGRVRRDARRRRRRHRQERNGRRKHESTKLKKSHDEGIRTRNFEKIWTSSKEAFFNFWSDCFTSRKTSPRTFRWPEINGERDWKGSRVRGPVPEIQPNFGFANILQIFLVMFLPKNRGLVFENV